MSKDLSVFTPAVAALIFKRDHGCCAKCGRKWSLLDGMRGQLGGWDMQHRMARGQGGSKKNPAVGDVSNGVILCRICHIEVEGKWRTVAWALGFAISRIGIRQPWEEPIRHALHGWVLLTQDGKFELHKPLEVT